MTTRGGAAEAWQPTLGAWPAGSGTCFRVWAPEVGRVELILADDPAAPVDAGRRVPLARQADGTHTRQCDDIGAGTRYRYLLDGQGPFPDPASRAQPDGVHGPSLVVDPDFAWTDHEWRGVRLRDLVVYELHVGAFTPAGTFAGVMDRLPYLAALGVTAVELMPVADFPGAWNWGYDGVALFAPARAYGTPDDFRRLVNRAHELGLAVLLDVVYNHLGPDGAYHAAFSPYYFSDHHESPWGPAINFDGPHAAQTRAFVIENALHWLHEYHADGLRLDATHAIIDDSPLHIMAELAARVRRSARPEALLIAEDGRNLLEIVTPATDGGWGLDAIWADDLHHQLRRATAGDADGYFEDYAGTAADIAATIRRGWFFRGQRSDYLDAPRGTDPVGTPLERFIVCLQNHDQVGNRAHGDRMHHAIDPATYRALVALLCCLPETPLLFMGQEWATTSPFQFFTAHHASLGRLVTEGRRREFGRFRAFADPAEQARIPDPQAVATFVASHLDWGELEDPAHARVHRLVTALLALRREAPALRESPVSGAAVAAPLGDRSVALFRTGPAGDRLAVVCHLGPGGAVRLTDAPGPGRAWTVAVTTEDAPFVERPADLVVGPGAQPEIRFARPGAVVLRAEAAA